MTRHQDTNDARAAADAWAAEHNLPPSGGYTGQWYISAYLGGWWPADWATWMAQYDNNPGSQIGGNVVAHQFTSNPIDQDEMLEAEIVAGVIPAPDNPDVDEGWQSKKDLVVGLAGELKSVADQLRTEASRKGGPRKTTIIPLADGVQARADQILA